MPMAIIDPEAWVDRHGDYLFRFALLRLGDVSIAEELVQETFLAALQGRARFEGKASERTWLSGILKHKIVDYFRRLSRETPLPDESDVGPTDELFDENHYWVHETGPREWGRGPENSIDRNEFWRVLRQCMAELPNRLSSAFALREFDEFSTDEICKVLNVSTTNLWVMLHRARAHLRLCLETNGIGEERNERRVDGPR